jgi:hypothetical protein
MASLNGLRLAEKQRLIEPSVLDSPLVREFGLASTEKGGLFSCPGGSLATAVSQEAVKALSWRQVNRIVRKFEALNPYRRDIIPGSVLKTEDDNYDPGTGKQRQLHCYAISAKRYALFLWPKKGEGIPKDCCNVPSR